MDPNIVKFLEEDEDEKMHSIADVEAITMELNRDIEGSASTLQQQPSDPDAALSSQSQFLSQWRISSLDGIAHFQSGQDLMAMGENEQHSSQLDLKRHGSHSQNRKEDDNSSHDPNSLVHNPSVGARPQPQDEHNTFSLSQPMGIQTSAEQPINIQGLDQEPNPEKESQMDKVQNISHHPSMAMGSNDQLALTMNKGNQLTNMGISSEQVMPPLNQHITGMMMSNQQAMTSGMSNQHSMTNTNQQLDTSSKFPIGKLFAILQPQLDKDKAMQLNALYFKLKDNRISRHGFIILMKIIVGDQMLRMGMDRLQSQIARNSHTAPNQFQSQPQDHAHEMQMPSNAQLLKDLSSPTRDNIASKSREVESQADSQGALVSQMSNSSLGALSHERKHPVFPKQVLNKQQQLVSQASLPAYGSAGSSYLPFPATNATSRTYIRLQSHPNMGNHVGPTPRALNMTHTSNFDKSHPLSDPKKMPAGSLTHKNSNVAQKQHQVSSMTHVKQKTPDHSKEQYKAQLSTSHGSSSFSPPTVKIGNTAPGNLMDEVSEMQPSRTGFAPPTSLVPAVSVSNTVPSPMETSILSSSRMNSLISPIGPGINSKTPPKKPLVGQKKPVEAPGSSHLSSKKQKVSGAFLNQGIEHLNDVTAISGINLREEEEQLFSGPKEDSRISDASRRVVQEEEELMLQKIPLQKKLMEILAKCGLKNMSNNVEKCLSLCVEERMHGLISNIIRLSKKRVDLEKPRHKTIITSDVRQQITAINRKVLEEWEKKQVETEKSQKLNEPESSGFEGDKVNDDNRARLTKVNKEEDDKMRTTAANSAVRAATGVGDMLSRWQLMAKQVGSDTPSVSQTGKDVGQNHVTSATEKRDSSTALATLGSIRKVGRNQVVIPQVARSISVQDVIGGLEREPQMSKSALLCRLYL